MLRKLAELLERCRVGANNSAGLQPPNIAFIKAGEVGQKTAAGRSACLLCPGKRWEMRVDLDKKLIFPTEFTQTTQRRDFMMWFMTAKKVTVPWEEGIPVAAQAVKVQRPGSGVQKWRLIHDHPPSGNRVQGLRGGVCSLTCLHGGNQGAGRRSGVGGTSP